VDAIVSQPTGSLSCKINGAQWTCPENADMLFKQFDTLSPIQILADRISSVEYTSFELDFRHFNDTGTFFLKGKDSILTNCSYSPEVPEVFRGIKDSGSFVTISQIDSTLRFFNASSSPQGLKFINLKGTFGFICLNTYGDTISITDGKFDLICNPYAPLP
jgi:hypothetical protein